MSNNQRHNLETFFLVVTAPELCQRAECTALPDRFRCLCQYSPKRNKITNGVIRAALHRLHEGGLLFRNITSFQDTCINAILFTPIFTRPTKRPTEICACAAFLKLAKDISCTERYQNRMNRIISLTRFTKVRLSLHSLQRHSQLLCAITRRSQKPNLAQLCHEI